MPHVDGENKELRGKYCAAQYDWNDVQYMEGYTHRLCVGVLGSKFSVQFPSPS